MSALYFDNNSTEALSDSRSSNSMSSPTLDSMLKSVSVAHAEIRLVIKVVMSSSSSRSCLELNELFKAMFSDSVIAFHEAKQSLISTKQSKMFLLCALWTSTIH